MAELDRFVTGRVAESGCVDGWGRVDVDETEIEGRWGSRGERMGVGWGKGNPERCELAGLGRMIEEDSDSTELRRGSLV